MAGTMVYTKTRKGRLAVALLISGTFVGVLTAIQFLAVNPREPGISRTEKMLDILFAPADTIAAWAAPGGHDAAHFVVGFLLVVVCSVIMYTVPAWAVMELLERFRRK